MKLKFLILFILFISLIPSLLFSQNLQKRQELNQAQAKIDSFFTLVKKITPSSYNELEKAAPINDVDLEKANRFLYEVNAYASVEYQKSLIEWGKDWEKNSIHVDKKDRTIRPGIAVKKVKEALADKYGWEYVNFLETPYLLKVKILDKVVVPYMIDSIKNVKIPEVDLKVEIIDIIKGKHFFEKGEIITIGTLPIWFQDTNQKIDFKESEIYILPIRHWAISSSKNTKDLALKLNGLHTIYKIENNVVVSPFAQEKSPNKDYENFIIELRNKILIDN